MTGLWAAYKLRWKRRRLLWRAFRARRDLQAVHVGVPQTGLLAIACLRNETGRLPYWLEHYRALGVAHFLIIDNASTDGTAAYLQAQTDVSLWRTEAPYREARFGLDWQNWLLMTYGHDRWCLTVDADELLVYAHHDRLGLEALTQWLDGQGLRAFGALMLDMYPKGALGSGAVADDPLAYLTHFDAGPYRSQRQTPLGNLWTQGGARERAFFADTPRQSPTLNKLPLIRWNRRYAYVNSTHSVLPPGLNQSYDGPGGATPSGVLLHTKFLPEVIEKSAEDQERRQHFYDPGKFQTYYDDIQAMPSLWHDEAQRYSGWEQLASFGLLCPAGFGQD